MGERDGFNMKRLPLLVIRIKFKMPMSFIKLIKWTIAFVTLCGIPAIFLCYFMKLDIFIEINLDKHKIKIQSWSIKGHLYGHSVMTDS